MTKDQVLAQEWQPGIRFRAVLKYVGDSFVPLDLFNEPSPGALDSLVDHSPNVEGFELFELVEDTEWRLRK